jgi:hypothetical protein
MITLYAFGACVFDKIFNTKRSQEFNIFSSNNVKVLDLRAMFHVDETMIINVYTKEIPIVSTFDRFVLDERMNVLDRMNSYSVVSVFDKKIYLYGECENEQSFYLLSLLCMYSDFVYADFSIEKLLDIYKGLLKSNFGLAMLYCKKYFGSFSKAEECIKKISFY